MRVLRIGLWAIVAIVSAFTGYQFLSSNGKASLSAGEVTTTKVTDVQFGAPFELVTNKGEPIRYEDLLGRPHAVFFGFTNCPDICPTTLLEVSSWMQKLGNDADKIGFYFFTVDPERDTPQVLDDYVNAFDPRIVGVTGAPEDVRKTMKDYRAVGNRVDLGDGEYTIDHSAHTLLLDAKGNISGTISYGEDPDLALAKLKRLIEEKDAATS